MPGLGISRQTSCFCITHDCGGKLVSHVTRRKHMKQDLEARETQLVSQRAACHLKWKLKQERYNAGALAEPVAESSPQTVLQAVCREFMRFTAHHGMTKAALSSNLAEKAATVRLSGETLMPTTYDAARKIVEPLLVPTAVYDCCINDCILYRKDYAKRTECPQCEEPRYEDGSNKTPRKKFTYISIKPRLERWLADPTLAKLLYMGPTSQPTVMRGIHDGSICNKWYGPGGIFQGYVEGAVPLLCFTDGVNPIKDATKQSSLWPIIITPLGLPTTLRQELGPSMLIGIVPGIDHHEPKSLDPFVELVQDELLEKLSGCDMYNAHLNKTIKVKAKIVYYTLDFPASAKLLHMPGQAGIMSCPICLEKGQYEHTLNKTLHISNRKFVIPDHPVRLDTASFISKEADDDPPPQMRESGQERRKRKQYDSLQSENARKKYIKEHGVEGGHTGQRPLLITIRVGLYFGHRPWPRTLSNIVYNTILMRQLFYISFHHPKPCICQNQKEKKKKFCLF